MPSHKFQSKQVQSQRILKKALKDDLLRWICEKHATNSPLDRKLLRDKALQISQALELTNFKCSEQWVTTFLKKYGFSTTLTTCAGPHFKDFRLWINLIRTMLTQYRYKDIFNVDELTMYSDIQPLKVNPNPKENSQDFQTINATNLISILFCCNSSGTDKLSPLICGPYKSNIFREDCRYCYNENSCISDDIFADWLSSLNHMMSQKNRKILLLLHRHRIRALGNTQLSNIQLIFFPADFPPHLRPLRRDVFLSAKMKYRLTYAEKILQPGSKWGLEEMIMAILKSWSEVPRELIISSFQRTTFRSDDTLLEIRYADWDKLSTGISFKRLITFDDHLSDIPNSIPPNVRTHFRGRHNYNLRTCTQQVFEVEESYDVLELRTLKEQYRLKNEENSDKQIPRETTVSSAENVNSNQEKNSHLQDNSSVGLDQEEDFENNLHVRENVSGDLENNKISIFAPKTTSFFIANNKDAINSLTLVLRKEIGPATGTQTGNSEDIIICTVEKSPEKIDCQQTREGGVDKQIEQDRLSSSPSLQIEQSVNINADCNRSSTPTEKRSNSNLKINEDEPPEKIQRIERDWAKQYETNYVFGSPQQNLPGPSTQNVDAEIIVESCVSKESQNGPKTNKNTGARFIFTVNGTAPDPSCSPKE